MTTPKDGQADAECSNRHQHNTALSPRGSAPTNTHREPILQDILDATSDADKQPGAVNPVTLLVKTSECLPISTESAPVHPLKQSINTHQNTDALKAHTSGLNEPDIDSLLELIQEGGSFEEESKPQRGKLAEAIMAVRDASKSKEWSNLLRGVIILTTCLEFPKGDVSEART